MLIVIVKILFFFINIFLETTLKMFELNEKVQVFDSITSIWENGRVLSRTDSNSFVVNFESYSSKHESNVDVINIRTLRLDRELSLIICSSKEFIENWLIEVHSIIEMMSVMV